MLAMQLTVADVGAVRYGVSPMVELTQGLCLLAARRGDPPHAEWLRTVRARTAWLSLAVLAEVVAACPRLRAVLVSGPTDLGTTIDDQLRRLRELPDQGSTGWEWLGDPREEALLATVARDGPARLAEALRRCWDISIQPHWDVLRRVLHDDVAARSREQSRNGAAAVIDGLHPQVHLDGAGLTVDAGNEVDDVGQLWEYTAGTGLVLVPSVFSGPDVMLVGARDRPTLLVYPARGAATVWTSRAAGPDGDSLAALLGRSRAAILSALDVPRSTTQLALQLGQTAPSVSQHLSVLRRSGLVTSWRSGRSVLYRQTPLAAELVGSDEPSAVEEA